MKQHKKLLLPVLLILLMLTVLFLLFEIPYGFRLLRKTDLNELVNSPGGGLLHAYDIRSMEIPVSEALKEDLSDLSDTAFRPAPFQLISFLGSERGMSFDYKEGTVILGERYLVFLRKNQRGLIRGLPIVYRASSVPNTAKIKAFLAAYQPENTSQNVDSTGAAKPPEVPDDLIPTAFSVYTGPVPEAALRYAEENESAPVGMLLAMPQWLGVPYDPEKPYEIGSGYYMYHLHGLHLSAGEFVNIPVLQEGYVLCFLHVSEISNGHYTMSGSPENAAAVNRLDLTNGMFVYDRSGDCFYVTSEEAVLLTKGSLCFRGGTNLCRIAKTRANAPEAVRRKLGGGKMDLIEIIR